jgi:hypothetical protein
MHYARIHVTINSNCTFLRRLKLGSHSGQVSMAYPWYVTEQFRSNSIADHTAQAMLDAESESDSITSEAARIQAIARSLWRKRAGVIFNEGITSS